jgi:hypothetical protein
VVDKDDELRDHLNILVQERIETVAVIVALSFGAFTILTLLENKQWDNSVSWWVLSIAYWAVLLGILFASLSWRTSISVIEQIRKLLARKAEIFPPPPWYSESDKEKAMEQKSGKEPSFIIRFIGRHYVRIWRLMVFVIGGALWISIGFHCGFGNPELLNPVCS